MPSKAFLSFLVLLLLSAAVDDQWARLTPNPADDLLASQNDDFPVTVVRPFQQRRSLNRPARAPVPKRGSLLVPQSSSLSAALSRLGANAPQPGGLPSLYLLMVLRR